MKLVAIFLLSQVAWGIQGFVVTQYWGWFVVPRFGAPPLGLIETLGLMLLATLVFGDAARILTLQETERRKPWHRMSELERAEHTERAAGRVVASLAVSALGWVLGWVLHWMAVL